MSFWDKVKEFVGVDNDYLDDDFYEDYDEFEDGDLETNTTIDVEEKVVEKKPSFKSRFSSDNKIDETNNDELPTKVNSYKPSYTEKINIEDNNSRREERISRRPITSSTRDSKGNMFVSIREPLNYEDGQAVLNDIMEGKSVILNLEMLEMDKKTQIFYFVSGGLYSLHGTLQNVTKDIFVIAPEGVEIDGAIKSEISKTNLYQI